MRGRAYGAFAVALILGSAGLVSGETISGTFEQFMQSRDSIEMLQASFVQTTITPDEILVSEGTITYVRPKRIIFRYDDPPLVYMVDLQRAYEYDPELEQVEIFELEDRPESEAFYLGFENDSVRLQEAYSVHVVAADNPAESAFALEFTPKDGDDDEAYFERVTLQLRKGDFLPTEILIVNDAESRVVYNIRDYEVNADLPPEQTHVDLPPDTVVVESDVYIETTGAEGLRLPRVRAAAPEAESRIESSDLP